MRLSGRADARTRTGDAVITRLWKMSDRVSAFERTPLEFALRDCLITAFVIVGVAMEVGIEPTVRHGADRGLIPIVVADECGAGDPAAARRSLDALAFAGDAILTDAATITGLFDVIARRD